MLIGCSSPIEAVTVYTPTVYITKCTLHASRHGYVLRIYIYIIIYIGMYYNYSTAVVVDAVHITVRNLVCQVPKPNMVQRKSDARAHSRLWGRITQQPSHTHVST